MKDRMKVYHGVPKSVTDENTIFYASFDGSIQPEIGFSPIYSLGNASFKDGVTGYTCNDSLKFNLDRISNQITCDLWLGSYVSKQANGILCRLYDEAIPNSRISLQIGTSSNTSKLRLYGFFPDFNGDISGNIPLIPKGHYRLTIDNITKRICIYVNGLLFNSVILNQMDKIPTTLCINNTGNVPDTDRSFVADLHISNIDRGDYFPNLPQDFIEGKAIIKERFGQQQIKGDPMYSQVTELKAEAGYFYDESDKSNSCFRHKTKPELRVSDSNWSNGAMLKIKGLNGEIISGIIDTDTALAKITRSANNPVTVIECDDVSKFNVEDTIVVVHLNGNDTAWTSPNTITNVNANTREITLNERLSGSGGFWNINNVSHYIFESTASSSSPVVKSQDGRTVVGTWSGLGTNEATFTLGTNTPSLEGKDLYVTYSLNIPSNNSHFPDIPYSVDKAFTETGVEMKPVTEIIIEDDFRGKNPKDELECPHFHGYNMHDNQSLPSPNQFSREYKSNYVDLIASKDGMYHTISCDTEGKYINTVFSFNLIEMVERKMGAIPSYDKVNWLRQNISMLDPKFYGFGYNSVNNRIRLVHWVASNGDWSTSEHATTNAYVTELKPSLDSKNIPMYITDGGSFIMVVQNTSPATTSASVINIDHVSISLGLKIPSNYQALYCDNKRAREDVCNPVLVQKETKTVQRLIPSKESFITESKVSRCINIVKQHPPLKDMLYQGDLMISTMGTGNTNIPPNYIELVSSLPNITKEPTYDFMSDKILSTDFTQAYQFNYSDREINNLGVCYQTPYYSYRNNGYRTLIDPTRLNRTNFISSAPYLYTKNGELTALVSNSVHKNMLYEKEELVEFKLPNRPLIK